jgi:hypothetical protein
MSEVENMPKINTPSPNSMWPWGGAKNVQEKLVRASQLQSRRTNWKRDKTPPLASAALLEFIGPAHSSEALRLPAPPIPLERDSSFSESEGLTQALERSSPESSRQLQKQLLALQVPAERLERLKSMLVYEEGMLALVGEVNGSIAEIERLRREEQQEEGY